MTKPTKWVRPAKTQISLGIRPVWSESSLSAWRKLGSLATHWAHSKDSDQTGWMPRLIWVFAGCTVTLLVLSCCGSNYTNITLWQQPFWTTKCMKNLVLTHLSHDMTKWVCAQQRLRSSWASVWSESSLGAQSFCWLCHVTAHFTFELQHDWQCQQNDLCA